MRSPLLAGIFLISLILVCAVGLMFLLRSTATASPIEAMPRDTGFLVRVQDPSGLLRGLSRTALAASGEDTLEAVIDLASPSLHDRGITLPAGAGAFLRSWQREVLLALLPGDANTPAGLVLVLELGAASHGFPRTVQQLVVAEPQVSGPQAAGSRMHEAHSPGTVPQAGGEGPGVDAAWTSRSHRGREYFTMRAGAGKLHAAGAKGLGILATTGAAMRRVLDTLDGRMEPLGSNPAYRVTRDRLGRRAGLLAWVSGAWAGDRMESIFTSTSERRALRLLGLGALRGAGLEIDLRGGLFRERLFAAMDSHRRGLPAELMAGAVRPHRASHLVPAGFPFYLSVSCSNIDAVYRRLPEILASSMDGNPRELRSRFDGAEKFMALDLASGLFAAFGDDMVIGFGRSSPWPRGAADRQLLQTPAVASISIANRSTIAGFLERLDGLARALAAHETFRRGDRTMTSYNLTMLAPMRPAYWLTSGRLVAATSPDILASALDSGARQESWADLPGMEDLLGRLPDRSHAMLMADSARVADLLGVANRHELPAELNVFTRPASEGLPPIAITARMISSGLLLDAVAPVSPSLLLALALAARESDRGQADMPQQYLVEETIPY